MLRSALDPISELRERFEDVKKVLVDVPKLGQPEAAQRRTSSFKTSKRALKSQKSKSTELVSLKWAQKRVRVERDIWDGSALPKSSGYSQRAIEDALQSKGIIHDASYEQWFELHVDQENSLAMIWESLLDPSVVLAEEEVTGDIVLYEHQCFPEKPICPIRLIKVDDLTVHISAHNSCSGRVEEAIRMAAASITYQLQKLAYYSFLAFGVSVHKWVEQVTLEPSSQATTQNFDKSAIFVCPFSKKTLHRESLEDHFFSQELGSTLSYDSQCTIFDEEKPSGSTNSRLRANVRKYCFVLGRKARLNLQCALIVTSNRCQAHCFWHELMREKWVWIGLSDLEYLYARLRVPSFPRDFPDTLAYSQYWTSFRENYDQHILKRPSGKRQLMSSSSCYPSFDGVFGIANAASLRIIRSWQYAEVFFSDDFTPDELDIDDLLLPVTVVAPRSRKSGVKFNAGFSIYLANESDYKAFTTEGRMVFNEHTDRRKIGTITSVHRSATETYGLGFISVRGLLQLLHDAREQNRKRQRSKLLILIFNPNTKSFGIGFISMAPS